MRPGRTTPNEPLSNPHDSEQVFRYPLLTGRARTDQTFLVIPGGRLSGARWCCRRLQRYDDSFRGGEHPQILGLTVADNLVDLGVGALG
jgi:hypothetical protein